MEHGFVNFPESFLSGRGFRLKRNAYVEMNRFWDSVEDRSEDTRGTDVKELEADKLDEDEKT